VGVEEREKSHQLLYNPFNLIFSQILPLLVFFSSYGNQKFDKLLIISLANNKCQ
jgi:hypothetical protein